MDLQNEKGGSEEPPQMVQYQIKINQLNFRSTEGGDYNQENVIVNLFNSIEN